MNKSRKKIERELNEETENNDEIFRLLHFSSVKNIPTFGVVVLTRGNFALQGSEMFVYILGKRKIFNTNWARILSLTFLYNHSPQCSLLL